MKQFFSKPNRAGGFTSIAHISAIREYLPFYSEAESNDGPLRKTLEAPLDNNTFVQPIKQCFVKNPRTMPMTRVMLILLAGWAGQGGSIDTTIGIVAKHLRRSRRQVFRYLKDAAEEGYLFYSKTKDRIGRYTGVRIRLNFTAIRYTKGYKKRKQSKAAENLDVTYMSDTNKNSIYNIKKDEELHQKLEQIASTLGVDMPEMIPI